MERPIRVLHVVTHMNRGGLETMIMNYYRNVDRSKVQFDFLTHRPDGEKKDYDDEIIELGGKIFHISRLNPFSLSYKNQLKKFFKEHGEYKIIHVHQDCLSGIVLKIAKQCNIPVRIAHCHSSNQDFNLKYIIKLFFKGTIKKYATDMFACGEVAGRWMFGKKTQFKVISNAIDVENYRFDPLKRSNIRNKLKISKSTLVIGLVARFSIVKNQFFLLKIFDSIHRNNPDSKVIFVGNGDTLNEVKQLALEKGLEEDVLFLGLRTDVPDLLQAFDFFVMPSLYEGLPVSIVEAQAAGLKCFISDKVPLDCAITNLVKQISLSEDSEVWADCICSEFPYERMETNSILIDKGFDIKGNAKFLEEYYLNTLHRLFK